MYFQILVQILGPVTAEPKRRSNVVRSGKEQGKLTHQGNNLTKKLLVVDDSPGELQIIYKVLSKAGYTIITASDGVEGVEKALSEKPDLITLDVVMPKKNGFQACRAIKSCPETQHIPIILLSSKSQPADKFWGMKQGADLYLTKPFVPIEFIKGDCQLYRKTSASAL
ncbi:MAG: response regulator [Candidatus Electrothrix sp. GM3_4]|nr:response regulator [Candidatus Electrothrix sp. GM3_4]